MVCENVQWMCDKNFSADQDHKSCTTVITVELIILFKISWAQSEEPIANKGNFSTCILARLGFVVFIFTLSRIQNKKSHPMLKKARFERQGCCAIATTKFFAVVS